MKGMKFGAIHSFNDLNLVLSEVDIPPAAPKTVYVDIPGADGSADLTEALGEVKFNDRECRFTFSVLPADDFEAKKRQFSGLLNGRRFHIEVDKDPGWYWDGRCSVDEYKSNKQLNQIVVAATVAPYKLKTSETVKTVQLGAEETEVTLANGRKTVVPNVTCTAAVSIEFNGNTFDLAAGTHKVLDLALPQGESVWSVTGSGVLTIKYTEGEL